jgi:hypothetical protein
MKERQRENPYIEQLTPHFLLSRFRILELFFKVCDLVLQLFDVSPVWS